MGPGFCAHGSREISPVGAKKKLPFFSNRGTFRPRFFTFKIFPVCEVAPAGSQNMEVRLAYFACQGPRTLLRTKNELFPRFLAHKSEHGNPYKMPWQHMAPTPQNSPQSLRRGPGNNYTRQKPPTLSCGEIPRNSKSQMIWLISPGALLWTPHKTNPRGPFPGNKLPSKGRAPCRVFFRRERRPGAIT
jgi:hypothetical protein